MKIHALAEGWRYTPAYGAAGTMAVGILALIASVIVATVTMRRAQAQHQTNRRDAHNDKVREHIAGVLTGNGERSQELSTIADLIRKQIASNNDPSNRTSGVANEIQRRVWEVLPSVSRSSANDLCILSMLTDDARVMVPMTEILHNSNRENKVVRNLDYNNNVALSACIDELALIANVTKTYVDAIFDFGMDNYPFRD